MTVETKEAEAQEAEATEKTEEKTEQKRKVSDEMYPDDVQKEEESSEEKSEEKTKEEDPKEGQEETSEQEETKDREEAKELTLTLSKDSLLDESAIESVKEYVKENKLSDDVAKSMLKREEDAVSTYAEEQKANHETSVDEWYDEINNDPKLGGDNLEKSQAIANRPLKKFGDQETIDFLDKSGFGNHPAVFKYHYKLGMAMGDDQFVTGDPAGKDKKAPVHERMYPNEVTKKE